MTLEEAIKTLEMEAHLAERQPETGICDALKLGIEAMKTIRSQRRTPVPYTVLLLPGETKEVSNGNSRGYQATLQIPAY